MAEYQNLFTSVQPVGPLHDGIELPRGDDKRTGDTIFSAPARAHR